MPTRALWIVPLVALAACGGTTPEAQPPAAPAHGIQLAAGKYTLPPGTEKYYCYATTLQEDANVAVTRVESFQGLEVHHMAVFRTLSPEPEGFSECPVIIKTSWLPIYANGTGNHAMNLPTNAGFILKANDQVLVQLHLLNASQQTVDATTYVNMNYADDPKAVTPAGIWAWGNFEVDMPAGAKDYKLTSDCTLDHDLNIFGWFPHMHQLGTSLTLETGADQSSTQMLYKRDPWVFGDQRIDEQPVTLKAGTYTKATCTFNNTTDHAVKFGESSNDEMCILSVFVTPFNKLDGCIVGNYMF